MDINFHYYAVKTLAIHAGFDEECANYRKIFTVRG